MAGRFPGTSRGRAQALGQISSMFRDTGKTVSDIFSRRAEEKREEAKVEQQKPVDELRKRLLTTQAEGAELKLQETKADIESDKEIEEFLSGFDINDDMRESVKTTPMKSSELLNLLKSAKERPQETVQEYAQFLDPESKTGQEIRSQLTPAQVAALDGMLESQPIETPEQVIKEETPQVDPTTELGKRARSTEIFDPTELGAFEEKEKVLQPGEKAPEKPKTSSFRFDVEEEPANVTKARNILSKLSGKRPTSKQQALVKRNQAIIDKFEGRKEKLTDVESGRDFQRELAKEGREFTEEQQKRSFENQKALKNMGFMQAKTIREMEEAAEKAKIDPNRPNDTTINENNRQVWDKIDTKYTKAISEHREALNSISKLNSLLDTATGAADIAAIFTFMKALDPRSVVRESEFKLPAEAAGVFSNMMNLGKKTLKGDKLSPEARVQLKDAARVLGKFYTGEIVNANNAYTKLSNAAKIDPALIIDFSIVGSPKKKESTSIGRFTIEEEEE